MKKHILQENYERFFGKREFGDPLPTFEDVMETHQVNKLKEDWWDNMDAAAQAAYIKKHPGSKQAQQADAGGGEPEDKPFGGDTGKDADYGGDEDDYDMGEVPGSREEWEDIEPGDPEMRSGDESAEELGDLMKQQQNHIEDMFEKGADREDIEAAEGNLEDLEREYDEKVAAEEPDYSPGHPDNMDDDELKQFLDKDAEDDDDEEPYKREPFQPGDDPEELSVGAAQDELEKAKAEMAHAEKMGDKNAYADAEEKEYALQARLGITGRTGNELNQETLTIDGKQFRRISEGVEKQPKPKYAFSEFYKRFKK